MGVSDVLKVSKTWFVAAKVGQYGSKPTSRPLSDPFQDIDRDPSLTHFEAECTKIAHRRSLAILNADEGIAGNSAARIIFIRFHRRKNRGLLAMFFAEEIAHLGPQKVSIFPGAEKIAAATAENRANLVHSALKGAEVAL